MKKMKRTKEIRKRTRKRKRKKIKKRRRGENEKAEDFGRSTMH